MDFKEFNKGIIAEFRSNGGRVGGDFEGAPMLLLTTVGRRSGNEHTTPLMYLPDDGRYLVFASKGGAPEDPEWFRNLKATPQVTVEVGDRGAETMTATEVTGEERDRLYAEQASRFPQFAEYEAVTDRKIPVVALS